MRIFYSDHIPVPLPENHRFPMSKYALLHAALLSSGVLKADELVAAEPASKEEIILAHTQEYYDDFVSGNVSTEIMREIGIPWSPELVQRTLTSMGGSIACARQALIDGFSGNLAGGTHHAQTDKGAGFCVFNDIAIICRLFLNSNLVERIAVIDLDVHQGNGTASILAPEDRIFLFSVHAEKNYPFRKVPSTLDIGLPDHTTDEEYLLALDDGLRSVLAFSPTLVLYQAGVDVLTSDRLGRLSLTLDGIGKRDYKILQACFENKIPLAMLMGGGYTQPIEDSVSAHVQSYRLAKQIYNLL